jgi:hypothetical protein
MALLDEIRNEPKSTNFVPLKYELHVPKSFLTVPAKNPYNGRVLRGDEFHHPFMTSRPITARLHSRKR